MNDERSIVVVPSFYWLGPILATFGLVCGFMCGRDSSRREARRRECAAICGHAYFKTVDRVCRCADGKVTVLP